MAKPIPSTTSPDSTLTLLREGYYFIAKRCEHFQTDIFQTRFLFQKTICFRGQEAARTFYDTDKFTRKKAAPKRIKDTLFGEGGVQGLDGEAHRQRKQIFMDLMTPEHMAELGDLVERYCRSYARQWQQTDELIVLFDEIEEILCRAVCEWSGVPLPESEVKQHTAELSQMIAGSGRTGPIHWQARQARKRAEAWIESILTKVRNHELEVPEGTAAHAFAWHRSPSGNLLDLHAAAVDLLNVIRPTVAIGRYITFAALALHEHPECRQKLQQDDPEYPHFFVQEVRRYYPFFPFAAAVTRHEFDWQGYHFPAGIRVLLDLYSTNRDPELWEEPDEFRPERFRHWQENAFDFIPQGGGDHYTNHRCAGEWLTIRIMERVLKFLVNDVSYEVPPQNLDISQDKVPTAPNSRFIIKNVSLQTSPAGIPVS
jgi:fatty-acid peroxygenase